MKDLKVGVLGATGVVGQEMLSILLERKFPAKEIYALASARSEGEVLEIAEREFPVQALEKFDTSKLDLLLASAGGEISAKYIPQIANNTVVIDNSSTFRTDPLVPLVIPEVNPEDLNNYRAKNIIANPNCSTIQMLLALAPLHRYSKIQKVVVSTYQSVSGAGKEALDELFNQTQAVYSNQSPEKTRSVFTKQIAFNVIPHIDSFLENGYTKEEWKMHAETQKILHTDCNVSATCVRVPVFVSHSLAVTVQFESEITVTEALKLWSDAPGVSVVNYNQDEGYVTPVEAAGEDKVYISRVRKDNALDKSLTFWVVADNLRKGAALNAVQIAELLVNNL